MSEADVGCLKNSSFEIKTLFDGRHGCCGGYTLLFLNGLIRLDSVIVVVAVFLLLCLPIVDITGLCPFPLLPLILILLALRYHPVLLHLLPHRINLILPSLNI